MQEKAAEIVNDLVKINNDRIEGYDRAIQETKDNDLQSTFEGMKRESEHFKQELSSLARQLGEEPSTGTRTDGKIYRAWMDVKATFTGGSRKAVLENCEFGEDAAQRAYRTALSEQSSLPPDVRSVVSRQQQSLRASHDKIKQMRDSER